MMNELIGGKPAYPLMENAANKLQAASGRGLGEITVEAAAAEELLSADLQVDSATLQAQARVARASGYLQLADNLDRAAELTRVPNDELLHIYEMLRPGRSSEHKLEELANRLESHYAAPIMAAFIREAAAVYVGRGLLQKEAS